MIEPWDFPLTGTRLGALGRGGAGKSTLTVLLAKTLRRIGYEVVVLDADSTNVGLPEALGIEGYPRSLIDFFGGMVFSGGAVTCPVDDPTPLPGATFSLHEIPREIVKRSPDGIWFLAAGKMGERGAGAGCDGPIAKIARDLRIHGTFEKVVTIVDFKAGCEDFARGVVTSIDWALVVVDPTRAAVQMAADLKAAIADSRGGARPATRHLSDIALVDLAEELYRTSRIRGVLPVLNNVPDGRTESHLRERLAEAGLRPLGVLPRVSAIAESWLDGTSFYPDEVLFEMDRIAEAIESAELNCTSEHMHVS